MKNEWISECDRDFGSTALTKRLSEDQLWLCISKSMRDMIMIFSPACRSIRGGTQSTHRIFIRCLDFSVADFEVQCFGIFEHFGSKWPILDRFWPKWVKQD